MFLVLKVSDSLADGWSDRDACNASLAVPHPQEGALLQLLSSLAQERDRSGSGRFALIGDDGKRHAVAITDLHHLGAHLTSGRIASALDAAARMRPAPVVKRAGNLRLEMKKSSFITSIPEAVRARLMTFEECDEQSYALPQDERNGLFGLGRVLLTPGAEALLSIDSTLANALLTRHRTGDWGCIGVSERRQNFTCLDHGWCVLSAYMIGESIDRENAHNTIWIATERNPDVTTVLLASEY